MITQERPQIALQRAKWRTDEVIKIADQEEGISLALIMLPGDDENGPCVIVNKRNLGESYDEDLPDSGIDITFYPSAYLAYLELHDLAEDWATEYHPEIVHQLLNDIIIWREQDSPGKYLLLDSYGTTIEDPYYELYLESLSNLWDFCTEIKMEYVITSILNMTSNDELQKLLANIDTNSTTPYRNYPGSDKNPYKDDDNLYGYYQQN